MENFRYKLEIQRVKKKLVSMLALVIVEWKELISDLCLSTAKGKRRKMRPSSTVSMSDIHKRGIQCDIITRYLAARQSRLSRICPSCVFMSGVLKSMYTCAFPPARPHCHPFHRPSKLRLRWPCSSSQEKAGYVKFPPPGGATCIALCEDALFGLHLS